MASKRALPSALILALLLALVPSLIPGRPARAAGVPLFAAYYKRLVTAGQTQKVWIHTLAGATVALKVDYNNGQTVTQRASTDAQGIHQFEWIAAYRGTTVTLAHYQVSVTRGSLRATTHGDFVLYPLPPFSVSVDVLTPRLHVGDTLRAVVRSRPNIPLALFVRDRGGSDILTRFAQADAQGNWSVSAPISAGITSPEQLKVVVTADLYGHHAAGAGSLVLRPLPTLLPPNTSPSPAPAPSLSLDQARKQAEAAADGEMAAARTNARTAAQNIAVDLQVLGQWTSSGAPHTAAYYQDLLTSASSYDDYITATARALSDDSTVQARMRAVMPHKAIMVSLQEQALRAYQDGRLVLFSYVTTGRPELPTVTGHFEIYEKVTPYHFISPWPQGSPFYYPPTWIKYWMPFTGGYGLHDAWWRAHYGPGTNVTGDGPGSSEPVGTHGCVNIPFQNTVWLWNWAPVHTPVVVYGGPSVKAGTAGL